MVESNRPQMTIWCIHIACWMTKATHTLRICNTYRYSTAKVVLQTRPDVNTYLSSRLIVLYETWYSAGLCRFESVYGSFYLTDQTAHAIFTQTNKGQALCLKEVLFILRYPLACSYHSF